MSVFHDGKLKDALSPLLRLRVYERTEKCKNETVNTHSLTTWNQQVLTLCQICFFHL